VELLALVVTGALAGWIAGVLVRGTGLGVVLNLLVGVTGGVLGGALLDLAGVAPRGWLADLAIAVLGAALLLLVLDLARRYVRRSA
jgi:uncharacterized membrane protein YeaQ/YmgE (transglycosylase-associated protein family)